MNHSTFKSFTFGIGLFFTLPLVYGNSSSPSSSDGTLYINKSKTHKVAPVKYGFHYEEIGMMGEGALHAELIRNRSFEEATPPAGLSVKNGLYENVPAPRVKEKKVFQADPLIGWTTYPLSYTPVFISRTDENPMSGHLRNCDHIRKLLRSQPMMEIHYFMLNQGKHRISTPKTEHTYFKIHPK